MATKVTNKVIKNIFNWCLTEYGVSKYQGFEPELIIDNTKDHPSNGEFVFEDNEVFIYPKSEGMDIHRTIFVMIHEFKHYHQSPVWLSRYINMYNNAPNCPYEIEADAVAEADWEKCYRKLFLEKA